MAIEEQIQYNAAHIIGPPPSWPGQVGQCLPIPGRSITKLGFWLSKYRFPTGGISFAIYRASDGALLGSQPWGDAAALPATLDPANLVTDAIYYEVTLPTPVDVDEEVYIVVDYASTFHDGSNNLWVMMADTDVKPDECLISRIGIWTPSPDRDCAYRYTYTVVPPTVTTQAVSDIEETTAKDHGEITDTGGEDCDKRGVCWKTTPGPTVADSKSEEIGGFGTGAFTRSMTGLSPGTKYYVRAYAHNSAGYSYGSEVTFTTKPQVATGFSATAIDENQIDVSWTAGAGATKTMVRRKVGSYPTSLSDGDQAYFDIGNSFSDLGLTPGTHYFYRAWSWVEGSDIWSDDYAEDDAATPLVPPEPPPPPAVVPEYQKRALVVGGVDVGPDNPLPVDLTPGLKTAAVVLNEATIAAGATTVLADCAAIDIRHHPLGVALTVEATYNMAAALGVRVHVRSSYNNIDYDTEDFDAWTVAFTAGGLERETADYGALSPMYLRVLIENLDLAQPVTNVIVTVTLGT